MSENPQARSPNQAKVDPALTVAPPVDVYEDASGIILFADMPGVSRESVAIHVDGDTLLLEGNSDLASPAGTEPVYTEVRGVRYRRSFTLSRELARDRIDAALKDGVLTVRIPKAQHAQPRRIEVRVG